MAQWGLLRRGDAQGPGSSRGEAADESRPLPVRVQVMRMRTITRMMTSSTPAIHQMVFVFTIQPPSQGEDSYPLIVKLNRFVGRVGGRPQDEVVKHGNQIRFGRARG